MLSANEDTTQRWSDSRIVACHCFVVLVLFCVESADILKNPNVAYLKLTDVFYFPSLETHALIKLCILSIFIKVYICNVVFWNVDTR